MSENCVEEKMQRDYEKERIERNIILYGSPDEPSPENYAEVRTNMTQYGIPTKPEITPPQTETEKELDAAFKWAADVVGVVEGIYTCINLYTYRKHITDGVKCHCDICERNKSMAENKS